MVIDFSCNRKPTYDFLLVINCHLSSISHRFWDIASRTRSKTTPPSLSPRSKGLPSNFGIKLGKQRVKALGYILVKTAWSYFCHSTLASQTDRQHIMTIAERCNANDKDVTSTQTYLYFYTRISSRLINRWVHCWLGKILSMMNNINELTYSCNWNQLLVCNTLRLVFSKLIEFSFARWWL